MTTALSIPDVIRVLGHIGACQASINYVNNKLSVQAALEGAELVWLTWLIETLVEERLLDKKIIEKKLEELSRKALADFPQEFDAFGVEAISAYNAESDKLDGFLGYLEQSEASWKATPERSRRESSACLVHSLYATRHALHGDRMFGFNLRCGVCSFLHLRDYGEYGDLETDERDERRAELIEATRKELCVITAPWLYEAFHRALREIAEKELEEKEEEEPDGDEQE